MMLEVSQPLGSCQMYISAFTWKCRPERGFSINKRLIYIHGYNIREETIEAVILVKDCLVQGRLENIVLNKQFIQLCSDARLKDLSEQDFKRKQAEKEKADKDKAKKLLQLKREKKSCEIENEVKFLKTAISIVDKSVTEGNLEFQCCMKCTFLN